MSPNEQPDRSRARLIVGIDYGTTYSGVSFAMSTATDFRDIFPWTAYPGAASHMSEHCEKAPSLLAFASENDELDKDAWGYQAEPGMKAYAWTKLLLDNSSLPTEFDDPDLKNAIGRGIMKLPQGRTAKEIVTAYLRGMNEMYQTVVAEKFGERYLENLPVDFWLTVPATWSDEAKQITMDAALKAGFASRDCDRVRLIPEPEAAAHLALKSSIHHVNDLIEQGASVMVCDLGGGTADITCYEIQKTSPSLKMREICVGGGGKCGGTFVDRNFHKLMEKRFGAAFTSLGPEMIGPGSRFMDQFEMAKRDFRSKNHSRYVHRLQLHMKESQMPLGMDKYYQHGHNFVIVSQDDMKSLFDPVGDMIVSLVSDQMQRAKRESGKDIDHMVLVGGFGSSPYIKERLQELCRQRQARLTTPLRGAWSAVVCGAVLRGIEGAITTEKRCRRHYGKAISHAYDPKLHQNYDRGKRSTWQNHYRKKKMLSGFMEWSISKNDILTKDSSIYHNFSQHFTLPLDTSYCTKLYACSLDEAPDTIESDRVENIGKIYYTLERLDLSKVQQVQNSDGNGSVSYRAPLTLNIRLSDEDGLLVFKILHEGEECGKAELAFSYADV